MKRIEFVHKILSCPRISDEDKLVTASWLTSDFDKEAVSWAPESLPRLPALFIWSFTPQGRDFWGKLDEVLKE